MTLTDEQQKAFDELSELYESDSPEVSLLYGITGSGKTSVFFKLIEKAVADDKDVIVMVPEIALTPQMIAMFRAHFGDKVAVFHSALSLGERLDEYKRVSRGIAKIAIGTRSAVFAPFSNLGLIIMDEEQEHTYKSESKPRFNAKELAKFRCSYHKALLLFSSATPSVETFYYANEGRYHKHTLTKRYGTATLPDVIIADMNEEIAVGNTGAYSNILLQNIEENLDTGRQSILLLNRRGYNSYVTCNSCREPLSCPNCSITLTYHSANARLMCHYCGHSQPVPDRCPDCGGPLKAIGTGTQKVQQELKMLYPDMESDRMDADTVSATNTHEIILDRFQKNRTPVLIGTQMVAKGLNLPDVTLVGVLDAELSLYNSSFRAAETTFNMLTQVVGRAGRGDMPGRAIIQTVVPDHQVIKLAAAQAYDGFYDLEVQLRQVQNDPPFGDLATITFTGEEETAVLRGAAKFRDSLIACLKLPEYKSEICTVLGPAPCAVPKINYNFRYRLTLRCRMSNNLRLLIAHLLRQFSQDKLNRKVNAFVDVNGYD